MSRRSSDQAQQLALPLPAAALHTAMLCCNGGLDVRSQWSNDINIWWDKCRKPCIYNLALLHQPVFDVASSKSKLIRAVFAAPERLKQGTLVACDPIHCFLRFEVKKIGSQVTKCAWSPTPVTQKWCVPFVVACDPIRARSIIFEGSLAEKFRFLSFEASFLKEVSQKSFF